MREAFGYHVKSISDHAHKELQPIEVYDIFKRDFVNITDLVDVERAVYEENADEIVANCVIKYKDNYTKVTSNGNGRLDAISNALKEVIGIDYTLDSYTEHDLEGRSSSKAASYVSVKYTGKTYWEYVQECEGKDSGVWEHLELVWKVMQEAVERGIEEEGVLPGPLSLRRKALSYHVRAFGQGDTFKTRGLVFAYALAVSEENAAGGTIVTAPTCGSCGVLPSVLYHMKTRYNFSDARIIRALATCGLIATIVKHNASISGAEVGCQGEVGVACAMAAAAVAQLMGGSPSQIEYAAEMGLEHHLGLTCDPVDGLVQIPCIERNAYAAARAMDAGIYALYTDGRHMVSFDQAVAVMKQTGHDLPSLYKETSEGGLAKAINQKL